MDTLGKPVFPCCVLIFLSPSPTAGEVACCVSIFGDVGQAEKKNQLMASMPEHCCRNMTANRNAWPEAMRAGDGRRLRFVNPFVIGYCS
jgi:hypothetical protein